MKLLAGWGLRILQDRLQVLAVRGGGPALLLVIALQPALPPQVGLQTNDLGATGLPEGHGARLTIDLDALDAG